VFEGPIPLIESSPEGLLRQLSVSYQTLLQ
jgi:hypothetical protein